MKKIIYTGNNGLILEFGKHERNGFYFDCFVSGYAREEEYLFIGGYAALKIKNVLHFGAEIENYSSQLRAIQCFISALSPTDVTDDSKQTDLNEQLLDRNSADVDLITSLINMKIASKQTATSLIAPYILNLCEFWCNELQQMEIDLIELKHTNFYHIIMNSEHDMVNLKLCCTMFPQLQHLRIILPNAFIFTSTIIRYLYRSLSSSIIRNSNVFDKIEFSYEGVFVPEAVHEQMATELDDTFANIGWIISIANNIESSESVFFVRMDADISMEYHQLQIQQFRHDIHRQYQKRKRKALQQPLLCDRSYNYRDRTKTPSSIRELRLSIIHEPMCCILSLCF